MNFLYRELLTTASPFVRRCGKPLESFPTSHAPTLVAISKLRTRRSVSSWMRLNTEPASAANTRAPDFPLYYISTPAFLETLP